MFTFVMQSFVVLIGRGNPPALVAFALVVVCGTTLEYRLAHCLVVLTVRSTALPIQPFASS